ncbi:phosphoglycerate mutase family protein [Brevundimonas kwangchunensis]|uniref:Phosphoglycerate mutase family protein n=1 Tax=Brevundimonas kwangchunensis TaxID=322163 RepID=A0ABP3S593_9CAUL
MKRILLAVAAATLLTAAPAAAQTVILVRHAEKADQSADPALSEAGQARAEALAQTLADRHPTVIVFTALQRTHLTARPSMMSGTNDRRPTVVRVPFEGFTVRQHIDMTVRSIREFAPDDVILVVGHSNTIPQIARALGYREAADMRECEFDRLTTLHLTPAGATGEVTRYGEPSVCE